MSFTVLQKKLEQKLDILSISLETLKDQQKKILNNEDKIKTSINHKVETQVHSLRRREKQLIRQVEVETVHHKSLIDSQIAELVHLKGYITGTQDILHKCKPEDILYISRIVEAKMSSLKSVPPLNLVSVQFDASTLTSAIKNFGTVHLSDTVAHHHSTVIPAKMEDYGDSEHDVLHKSIEDGSPDGAFIKVQFPKIPSGGWLATSPKTDKPVPSVLCSMQRKLSQDVSSWLADLRVSQSLEENKTGVASFALDEDYYVEAERTSMNSLCKGGRSRDSSLSFEIVPCPESEKDCCSQAEENWTGKSGSTPSENRSSTICDFLAIEEFACQANEPCKSYKDCVCDGYCAKLAKERSTQTSKWLNKIGVNRDAEESQKVGRREVSPRPQAGLKRKLPFMEGTAEVLNHMSQILNSNPNNWLAKRSCNKATKTAVSQNNITITYKPPTAAWLCQRVATESKTEKTKPPPTLSSLHSNSSISSPHSSIWLLHKHKEELQSQKEKESNTESADQDQNTERSISVNDLKGALAELAVLAPKIPYKASQDTYNLSQENGSDLQRKLKWLSRSHDAVNPGTGCADPLSWSSTFLPQSLEALAEFNLDRWLIYDL